MGFLVDAECCEQGLAEGGVDQKAYDDDVGAEEVAGVVDHVADPGSGVDLLGDNEGEPGYAERVAETGEQAGESAGQDDAADEGEAAEAEDAAGFEQLRVGAADGGEEVEVDGGDGEVVREITGERQVPGGGEDGAGCCDGADGDDAGAGEGFPCQEQCERRGEAAEAAELLEARGAKGAGGCAEGERLAHRATVVVMNEPPPVSRLGPVFATWVPTPSRGNRSSATR